jgi:superfamily II DNA or RNA helicase
MAGVLLNPSEALSVRKDIEEALRENPGVSARKLSQLTEWTVPVCEQVLYGNQDRFLGQGKPVRWKIRGSGPAAKKRPKLDASGKRKLKRSQVTETWQPLATDAKLPTLASLKLYPWQKEALKAWQAAGSRGIVSAVTGAGKTRVALGAIRMQLGRRGRVVVVVPTRTLQLQWFDILTETFPGRSVARLGAGYRQTLNDGQILVAIVDSGRNVSFDIPKGSNCLLVADECHRYASSANRRVLEEACNTRLGLTATLERPDGLHRDVLEPYFGGIVYRLGYREALAAKVIAPFRFAAVGASFTPRERAEYDELTDMLKELRTKLIKGWDVRTEPFADFLSDVERLIQNGPKSAAITAGRWRTAWVRRRELLGQSKAKADVVLKIRKVFDDADRSIVFCSTIQSAQDLGRALRAKGVSAAVHTSATTDEERKRILDVFSGGDISVLVTVQTLDEGVDVPEADLAVILGSTQNKRQMVQRMGRVIRRKQDRRYARFVYLFINDTVEDPAEGAHESFLEDMFDAADEMETFSIPGDVGAVRRFLKPKRRTRQAPATSRPSS